MEIKRTRIADLLKRTDYGQEVLVKGWVRTKRGSKTVSFIALNDGSTIKNVQIVADLEKFSDELMKLIAYLNDVLNDAITRVQPPTDKGKRLKIYYMTQVSTKPPTFVIFCNNAELFHFSYQRYIENKLREVFGFEGTPIRFIIRERGDEKD